MTTQERVDDIAEQLSTLFDEVEKMTNGLDQIKLKDEILRRVTLISKFDSCLRHYEYKTTNLLLKGYSILSGNGYPETTEADCDRKDLNKLLVY